MSFKQIWPELMDGRSSVSACNVVVCAHAQIGGIDRTAYEENNVFATRRLLDAVKTKSNVYIIHISSSVVEFGGI